jgi:hypothetical protein
MPKIQTKTIWAIPKLCCWLRVSYIAAMMVQRMKEITMPRLRSHICQLSCVAFDYVVGKHIPQIATRKSGRRPTRSTMKAAVMETIKLRRALPIES